MKEKKLIFFSGGDFDRRGGRLHIAATSRTDAAELMELARRVHYGQKDDSPVDPFQIGRNTRRIKDYFGQDDRWGKSMDGKPAERGVWHEPSDGSGWGNGNPVRLV